MKPYSQDFRKAAINAYHQLGKTLQEIAIIFGIHPNTLKNWLRMEEEGKEQVSQGKGHRPRLLNSEHLEIIRKAISENNSLTIKELKEIVGIDCTDGVYQRALKEMGYTYKKNGYLLKSKKVLI